MIFFLATIAANAQVQFGNEKEGYYIEMDMEAVGGDSIVIIVRHASSNCDISYNPKMQLRMFDGTTLNLTGKRNMGKGPIGAQTAPYAANYNVTEARYLLTQRQAESVKFGIKKVIIDTTKKAHEMEWTDDTTGKMLYHHYTTSLNK